MTIIAPINGDITDPDWASDVTEAANQANTYLTAGAWTSYTPTITNGGTAVISASGRWRRIAPRTVIFRIGFTVTTGGSGAGIVTLTLPTEPDRTVRTYVGGGSEGGTDLIGLHAITLTSGSGAQLDRLRYGGDSNVTGADLTLSKIFQFQGEYEELT